MSQPEENQELIETQTMAAIEVSPASLIKTQFIQTLDMMIEGGYLDVSYLIILISKLNQSEKLTEDQVLRLLNAANNIGELRLKENAEA